MPERVLHSCSLEAPADRSSRQPRSHQARPQPPRTYSSRAVATAPLHGASDALQEQRPSPVAGCVLGQPKDTGSGTSH